MTLTEHLAGIRRDCRRLLALMFCAWAADIVPERDHRTAVAFAALFRAMSADGEEDYAQQQLRRRR